MSGAHTNKEWMVGHLGHDLALLVGVIDKVTLDDAGLLHDLHGIDVLGLLVSNAPHLAERSHAQHREQIKVLATNQLRRTRMTRGFGRKQRCRRVAGGGVRYIDAECHQLLVQVVQDLLRAHCMVRVRSPRYEIGCERVSEPLEIARDRSYAFFGSDHLIEHLKVLHVVQQYRLVVALGLRDACLKVLREFRLGLARTRVDEIGRQRITVVGRDGRPSRADFAALGDVCDSLSSETNLL